MGQTRAERVASRGHAGLGRQRVLGRLASPARRRGGWLDERFGFSQFGDGIPTKVAGVLLMIAGGAFAFWSVLAEVRIGRGTPVPMIPTQRLVVVPPFTFCRNPMVLGTATAYLGLSV